MRRAVNDAEALRRATYTDGLRVLANLLENHPELPLPYEGDGTAMTMMFWGPDAREELAAAARALPIRLTKNDPARSGYDETYFNLDGNLNGLRIQLTAHRTQVCERVVTGTRTVTEEVPDPDAPKVTRIRVEEIAEWRCRPLLTDDAA